MEFFFSSLMMGIEYTRIVVIVKQKNTTYIKLIKKPFKDTYLELTKSIGGPYVLISKGLKRSIIDSVMRGSIPSLENAYEIAKILEIPLERLLGVEPPPIPEKEKHYEIIPCVEGKLSGGSGSIPQDEIKDWFWIPKKYLHRRAGFEFQFAAIEVEGISMEPLLFVGDTVIIDRAEYELEHLKKDSLYAVYKEGQNFVKQLHYDRAESVLHLISYNAEYTRQHGVEHIKLRKGMKNPVIGKVVFSFRRWK